MRGKPYWNREAFNEAAVLLREAGWLVENPHELDEAAGYVAPSDGAGGDLREYPIGQDLLLIAQGEAVFLLPGWGKSQGARLECYVALDLGVPVFDFETGEPIASIPPSVSEHTLPTDSSVRKGIPIATGVLDYFPAAIAALATVSRIGNDKHNPGEPLHWARGKSIDQADAIARHLIERGGIDPDTGLRHSAQLAWRALALLQVELEEAGEAPLARGATR